MRTYLVDFENVKSKGLVGIDKLTEDDHVIIFFSENSDTISFEMHCQVMQSKAKVDYMKVKVGGKNALDFQLSTLLGYLVAKDDNTHIFIISNDKGFDKLHDFWSDTFIDSPECVVFRTQNITSAINYARNCTKASVQSAVKAPAAEQTQPSAESTGKVVEFELSNREEKYHIVKAQDSIEQIKRDAKKKSEDASTNKSSSSSAAQPSKDNVEKKPVEAAKNADLSDKNKAEYKPNSEQLKVLRAYIVNTDDDSLAKIFCELKKASSIKELNSLLSAEFNSELANEYCEALDGSLEFVQNKMKDLEPKGKQTNQKPIQKSSQTPRKEITLPPSNETIRVELTKNEVDHKTSKSLHDALGYSLDDEEYKKLNMTILTSINLNSYYINLITQFGKEKGVSIYERTFEIYKEFVDYESFVIKEKLIQESKDKPIRVSPATKKKLHALLDKQLEGNEFSSIILQMNRSPGQTHLMVNLRKRFGKSRGDDLFELVKDEFLQMRADAEKNMAPQAPEKPRKRTPSEQLSYDKIKELLKDTEAGEAEFNFIEDTLKTSTSRHEFYLSMLKKYKANPGRVYYALLKGDYNSFKMILDPDCWKEKA
ncbi:MAG: PIN domain-containing protein [Ruminococcus sp.]|nr:PIN domain-containing protein [Ruminococcus sp.]